MQKIHFSVLPCRRNDKSINPDWIKLCLVDESGSIINSQEVRADAWREDQNSCRIYWKRALLSNIHKELTYEGCKRYIPSNIKYFIDKDIYDDWYRWYYYIDGEDAHEYITYCDHSQHTTNIQVMCGVTVGWKFYKKLREHGFNASTSAMLAYARGYLAGMEINSPWDSEGMEALECLGLTIEGGSDALRAF